MLIKVLTKDAYKMLIKVLTKMIQKSIGFDFN